MSTPGILEAWRALLPRDVAISAGPLLVDAPALTAREETSAGAMDGGRRLEFKTGRAYAKRALSKLGCGPVELPVGADKAPTWPLGVRGSITHTSGTAGGHVAAAVARSDAVGSIGIDAEVNRALHPATWKQFLAWDELQRVRQLPVESRASTVLSIWCVKEAAGKALGEPIEPTDIAVWHERALSDTQDLWRVTLQRRSSRRWSFRKLRDNASVPLICPTCQNVLEGSVKASMPATPCYFAWGCFRYFDRERLASPMTKMPRPRPVTLRPITFMARTARLPELILAAAVSGAARPGDTTGFG
jgi:4'-phosphopantetheinyl transferase EntD